MMTVLRLIPELLKVLKEPLKWLPLLKELLEELRDWSRSRRRTSDAPATSSPTVVVRQDNASGDNRTVPFRRLACIDLRKWIEAAN